jgi:hypothetical protein
MPSDLIDMGACCACEGTENVRNVIQLSLLAPKPDTGWGCVTCHIRCDGALAVMCDECMDTHAEILFAVDGYVCNKKRIKIDELNIPFGHDMRYHKEHFEKDVQRDAELESER